MSDMKLLPPPPKPAVVVHARNPFQVSDREIYQVTEPVTIREWLDGQGIAEFQLPTICLVDGDPVLRAEWPTRRIEPGSVVAFVAVPGFGAIAAAIVAAIGVTGTAAAVATAVISTLLSVATSFGLSQLANLLIGAPKGPSTRAARDQAAPSPTYSVQAQGNLARLGASIPSIYGEHRVYPDFATAPYTEFEGGEQYLYQLFCIGLGEYDILDQRIEDTPFASFPECTVLGIYGPGQPVTALPAAVYTSVEVANQELLQGQWVGHFIVNPSGTSISQIAVDVVAPYGMYYANDQGDLDPRSATVSAEAALVDDAGNLIGAFTPIVGATISAASNSPIRKSYRYTLPTPGRWAVRMTRTDAKDTSSRSGNTVQWTNLRGYTTGAAVYPGVTTVATRFRASNNLSEQSSRRVNFKVARKLSTWNPVTRQWGAAVRTRSIAWALADICRASYGAGLADSRYDIDGLYALEQTLAARNAVYGADGDWCDIVFDNAVTVWEALTTVARLGRAMPVIQGGVIRFVRDQSQSLYTAMFTPRNIVKDSFAIEYVMPSDDTADAVIVEYWDAEALRPREVTAKLEGSSAAKPAKVKLTGCTSQAHAWREGMYIAAANRYRRKAIKFQTELEGHIPMVGDLIVVSHDMPVWGVGGEIVDYDSATKTFTLSEPVAFGTGDHYLALRRRDGGISGPWRVVEAVPPDPYKVMLGAGQTLDIMPYTGGAEERTHFAFGQADTADNFELFRVMAPIRYRGDSIVEITAVNEHSFVHLADSGQAPPIPNPALLPTRPTRPVLTALAVTQSGTPDAPVLNVSWQAAPGATHYLVELSRDNDNWSRVADSLTTSIRVPVEPGVWWVRVAAAGLAVGPFLSQQITAGVVPPPGVVQGLAQAETFTGTQARIQWTPTPRATHYRLEVWAAGEKRRDAATTVPAYAYSAEDVKKDGGPWRSLTFRVWAVSGVGESDNYAELTLSNPAPGPVIGVNVYAGIKTAVITYDRPTDLDFEGIIVCASTTQGFTPDPAVNQVYRGDDQTITIPDLTEDVTYYFRVAAYDTFGTDSLDFGANEYSATVTAINLPTPQETLEAVQEALDDPNLSNKIVFDTNAFVVKDPDNNDLIPFAIVDINGVPTVAMQANVYVMGHISADQIQSGDIAAGKRITLNNGRIALDGNGAIFVYGTGPNPTYPDFAVLYDGDLSFQRYRGGVYYEHKSVKRVETGQAPSGATVRLPGYWNSQPKVMVSPYSLTCYNKDWPQQHQALEFMANNVREAPAGSGVWYFNAVARLTFASSVGSTPVNKASGTLVNDGDWNSAVEGGGAIPLPQNCVQITVKVRFRSRKGTGTDSNLYYARRVHWQTHARIRATGQWVVLGEKVRYLSAAEHDATISDSMTLGMAAGYYDYVAPVFYTGNTGPTYYIGAGGGQYEYATDQTSTSTGEESTPDVPLSYSRVHPLNGYTLPPGWSWHSVTYYYEWRNEKLGTGGGVAYYPHGAVSYPPETLYQWASVTENGAFNGSRITVSISNYALRAKTRNRYATITRKRLLVSDVNAYNNFYVDAVDWTLAGGAVLAQGGLNWMAIGD